MRGLTGGDGAAAAFLSDRKRAGEGGAPRWRAPDTGPSVLQLRHFVQVRSQHFRSFYVVMPNGERQVIVLPGVRGPGTRMAFWEHPTIPAGWS